MTLVTRTKPSDPEPTPPSALPAGIGAVWLDECAADQLIAFRRRVVNDLHDPDFYVLEHDQFVYDHLGLKGETIGLFADGEMIGYAMIGLPEPDDPDNLGVPTGLPTECLGQVAHIASVMVTPRARGHGLHKWLLSARLSRAMALGRRHAIAMVSLHNDPCWRNLCRAAMYVKRIAQVECRLTRFMMHRDLSVPTPHRWSEITSADPWDILEQRALVDRGLWGINRSIRAARCRIVYARPVNGPNADAPD